MSATRHYSDRTLAQLWGRAAGLCAHPGCYTPCLVYPTETDKAVILADRAHMFPISTKGPRAGEDPDAIDLNDYDNLLLLCATHHRLVDGQPNKYPAAVLREWKADLETWVQERLAQAMPDVTFVELETVSEALLGGDVSPSGDFTIIDPREKMERNGLSQSVGFLLTQGTAKAPEVKTFVVHMSKIDASYPDRLTSGFVEQYRALRDEGNEGDDLFMELYSFASGGRSEPKYAAAGLAVLAYLFQLCEVFEK